jgi:hypothetical protein
LRNLELTSRLDVIYEENDYLRKVLGWLSGQEPQLKIMIEEFKSVTSLVLTCIQNVEFQKLELKWSARKSNKIVFLLLSPQFLDLILASTMLIGLITC